MSSHPTPDSLRLHAIAERIVDSLDRHAPPRTLLLAGSAGEGIADELSDVDLIAYYDRCEIRFDGVELGADSVMGIHSGRQPAYSIQSPPGKVLLGGGPAGEAWLTRALLGGGPAGGGVPHPRLQRSSACATSSRW